jgi:hypothetical protein
MSHVEVLPLKRPQHDYGPIYWPTPVTLPTIVSKRRVTPNPVTRMLGCIRGQYRQAEMQTDEAERRSRSREEIEKQRGDREADTVVGPSSVTHPIGTKKLKHSRFDDDE